MANERSSSVSSQVVNSLSSGMVAIGGRGVPALRMDVATCGARRIVGVEGGVLGVSNHVVRALIRSNALSSLSCSDSSTESIPRPMKD